MDTNSPTNDTDFMKDKSVERITFFGLFLSYFNYTKTENYIAYIQIMVLL